MIYLNTELVNLLSRLFNSIKIVIVQYKYEYKLDKTLFQLISDNKYDF